MSIAPTQDPRLEAVLRNCARALRQVASYALPSALDRRLLELGERKENLSADEREQLLALVAFTQERTVEKLQAEVALRQLHALFPDEVPL